MHNYYKYGNFTYGIGTYGFGPAAYDQEEQMIVKYNTDQTVYTSLVEYGDVVLFNNPTIVAGDVKISKDGGTFVDLTNLPNTNGTQVGISLTSSETQAKLIEIVFKDQTDPPEWNDRFIIFETYGNDNAYVKFDYTNNVSATNVIEADLTPITDMLNNPVYGLSAINTNVLITSGADLTPVTSGVNYIISQIDNTNYGLSAIGSKVDSIPTSIENIDVDGIPFSDALTKILSWAVGQVDYNGNGEFVYYKQDNTTSAFGLIATDTNRTRF